MKQGVASSLTPPRVKEQCDSNSGGKYTGRESVSSIILNHQQSPEIHLSCLAVDAVAPMLLMRGRRTALDGEDNTPKLHDPNNRRWQARHCLILLLVLGGKLLQPLLERLWVA